MRPINFGFCTIGFKVQHPGFHHLWKSTAPLRPLCIGKTFSTCLTLQANFEPINIMTGKRPRRGGFGGKSKKFLKKKEKALNEGKPEEVLLLDIQDLLASQRLGEQENDDQDAAEPQDLPQEGSEIEVEVIELSSTGDGLARQPGSRQIYVVPFTVPGDTAKIHVFRHLREEQYTVADLISITKPSPMRDDSRVRCQYFGKCPGCQFQMLDYGDQLKHKRQIVERAFRHFSDLPPELVPEILETIGSPLQFGYRTKLTPHFDGPTDARRKGPKTFLTERPPIGFTLKGRRKVLDIEDCPIGTDSVRKGMKQERERMATEFGKYSQGATILLRENTKRVPKTDGSDVAPEVPEDAIQVETDSFVDHKTYITDNNATSTEYIDDFIFTNPAGAFFQNNNSILPPFTNYIREHILPPPASVSPGAKPIRNLIDAYSGSGLFTITLSSLFASKGGGSIGIDIAEGSISFARRNATLNGLDEKHCSFIAADAPELFKSVAAYDPDETVVVLDPPRKGCDTSFLRQLLQFGPRRVVYVSCNVHTQARDVGVLVRGEVSDMSMRKEGAKGGGQPQDTKAGEVDKAAGEQVEGQVGEATEVKKKTRYEIESLRGFDFFPQTGHVEGVAVLNRVDM
jgi:tRNA (uracil-5-)-methyltransferase